MSVTRKKQFFAGRRVCTGNWAVLILSLEDTLTSLGLAWLWLILIYSEAAQSLTRAASPSPAKAMIPNGPGTAPPHHTA